MKIDPETFRGKVYLLVIDKVIIGALIALAFVIYNSYRENEAHNFQIAEENRSHTFQKEINDQSTLIQQQIAKDSKTFQQDSDSKRLAFERESASATQESEQKSSEIQLRFERARLAKEFLPFITDKKEDTISRGYALRESVRTGAIDPEAAVELGRQLFEDGIPDDHFREVMVVVVPDGVAAIARRGVEISASWSKVSKYPFNPEQFAPVSVKGLEQFAPVSAKESIPAEFVPLIHEGRLWRSVLIEGFSDTSRTTCDNYQDASKFAPQLYGLFVLMQASNPFDAIELSRNRCHAVSLVGNLSRVLLSGRDEEAVRYLSAELALDHASIDNLRIDSTILEIFSTFGMPITGEGVSSGPPASLAVPIAQILVEPPTPQGSQPVVSFAQYLLRCQAAEVLDLMARTAKIDHFESDPSQGARPAESVLVSFLSRLATELGKANDETKLKLLYARYDENLIRRVVAILGSFDSAEAQAALAKLQSVGSAKLRHVPFLEEDLQNSLRK